MTDIKPKEIADSIRNFIIDGKAEPFIPIEQIPAFLAWVKQEHPTKFNSDEIANFVHEIVSKYPETEAHFKKYGLL